MEVESKTSDEILEELFSALNVPLSPKRQQQTAPESPENSPDSDGSEDKEANSRSSETEEESKEQGEGREGKSRKHKSSKKKKVKKKKKKKHKKKDEDGRHKSKKKHRRSSVAESAEEEITIVGSVNISTNMEEVDVKKPEAKEEKAPRDRPELKDGKVAEEKPEVNSNKAENSVEVNNHCKDKVEVKRELTKSSSPKSEETLSKPLKGDETDKSASVIAKGKTESNSESGQKETDLAKKLALVLKSPQRSLSKTKSIRSRSRSTSRARRQRSGSRHGKHSRSRSRSRSKRHSRHSRSRSRSRTKSSSRYRSRAKSPGESGKLNHKRKFSRSRSKSISPKSSKRRLSISRSRSPYSKNQRRRSRSHSKSLSPKFSRKRHRRSRSHSPSKTSSKYKSRSRSRSGSRRRRGRSRSRSGSHRKKYKSRSRSGSQKRKLRSRSRSGSPKKTTLKGMTNSTVKVSEETLKLGSLIDLHSIPTPNVQKPTNLPSAISLESIPLPVPPTSSDLPDPSCIPLPQPAEVDKDQENSTKLPENADKEVDVLAIPVPETNVETPAKEQETSKSTADSGGEKNKAKTIIIKSLKDSLIYMQAQEEAERRAKVKQEDENDDVVEKEEDVDESSEPKIVEEEKKEEETEVGEIVAQQKEEKPKDDVVDECVKKSKDTSEMEDGEILSENEGEKEEAPKTKSHKKKSKKDKDKSKDHEKKKKKDKNKDKDKKKQTKEKSRSKERIVRSRSRSKEKAKHNKSSSSTRSKEHEKDRRHRKHSRSRSRSRDRHSRPRRRSYSRSRSRSRSRSGRKRDCVTDLRDKVNRKRLLEIARRNAVYLMQNGCLPLNVEQEQLVKIKTSGKSVEELTDFCKQLVASGNYSDVELSDPSLSSEEENDNPDKPFSYTRHPFNVRDNKPILMNIRNAPMLPTKTNAERLADHAKLREQFPVSSGSQHRNKGETGTTDEKVRTDSGWVPVSPKETKKEEDSVFSKEKPPAVDISQIVSSRLSAMRKLQDNPNDMEALKTLHNVQKDMQNWALSKQEPGQFTGSTGVKILSQEELSAGQQAWVRKEQFKEAAPVRPQFGLKMLQKMGWTPGEGLGKNKEGAIEPLLLDVKMDKKGFHAQEELTPKKQPIPMAKDLSGKHPVSALVELCSKHKWQPPEFEMVFDYGPDHKKNFLMKVKVNGQEYKPAVAGPTKKLAKANAAAACLQSLGLLTRDPENPLTEASS